MFRIEQNIDQNLKIRQKNAVLTNGTALAKARTMKFRITHKELSIIAGIIVAMIVAVTFLGKNPTDNSSSVKTVNLPEVSIPNGHSKLIHFILELSYK
jgi:hypothetical protein